MIIFVQNKHTQTKCNYSCIEEEFVNFWSKRAFYGPEIVWEEV